MKNELEEIMDKWETMRQLTLDLLKIIPEERLEFTVGENMGSIGKQYRHLGDVQICYNQGIKTGRMSFDNYRRDYSLEMSKEKLEAFLEEINREMFRLIEANSGMKVDWFGEKWTLKHHLEALVEHEILHHGELIVYIRTFVLGGEQNEL